jgi:hypothetical protein
LNLDGKDQKSIANKLDQASKQEKREEAAEQANKQPPTQAARDVSSCEYTAASDTSYADIFLLRRTERQ